MDTSKIIPAIISYAILIFGFFVLPKIVKKKFKK
jgi:hypothetical protein